MRDWLNLLADPGSIDALPGTDESMAAARCAVGGHELVVVWCRFDVAAGTLSVAAGQRFVEALDAATDAGLPVLAIANSGGARMQEGTRAFVQMMAVTAAVRRLRNWGLPLIVYLANPTTGGVFASWGSLGHITWAEPGATIGFTGPRVAEQLGETIEPASVQTAEGQLANGHIDDLVAPDELRARVASVLSILSTGQAPTAIDGVAPTAGVAAASATDAPTGWEAVVSSRRPGRLCVLDQLLAMSDGLVELRGDRAGGTDDAVSMALGRFDGAGANGGPGPVLVIGHARGVDGAAGRPSAVGIRAARRAMDVAIELGLPIITVIDTAGARISGAGEASGIAGEIARSIDTLGAAPVPTVAVVAGQGSGGAAMAWLAADVVIAADDAWVAPIAPEAASIIVHRTSDHAGEMATEQRVSASELMADGIVDQVVPLDRAADAALAALRPLSG